MQNKEIAELKNRWTVGDLKTVLDTLPNDTPLGMYEERALDFPVTRVLFGGEGVLMFDYGAASEHSTSRYYDLCDELTKPGFDYEEAAAKKLKPFIERRVYAK